MCGCANPAAYRAECRKRDAACGRGADRRGGAGRAARAGDPRAELRVAGRARAWARGRIGRRANPWWGARSRRRCRQGSRSAREALALDGEDLVRASAARRRALLGREIAFIPQQPMTALNPVMSIGAQIAEHLRRLGVPAADRRKRARRDAGARASAGAAGVAAALPAPALGRHVPARADRHGLRLAARAWWSPTSRPRRST